jgi:hypothetical protein
MGSGMLYAECGILDAYSQQLNNSTTQQLNSSTAQQLNSSTAQQLNSSTAQQLNSFRPLAALQRLRSRL